MKWQQKYTGTMNRFPAFNGMFVVYFVGDVDNLRNVRHAFRGLSVYFTECSLCISWLNVDTFVCIRKIFYGWTLHICIVFATHKMFECCTFVLYQCGFYFFALFFCFSSFIISLMPLIIFSIARPLFSLIILILARAVMSFPNGV